MPSHTPRKVVVVHKQSVPLLSLLTTFVSVLLIVAGAIGLVLIQRPIQQPQDTRTEASIPAGPVILSTNPEDNSTFRVNQETKIDLQVNTGGLQTTEISLVFSILTETTDNLIIQTYSDTNLEITHQEIEQIDRGLLVSFKARPRTGFFSSTTPRRVASVIFTPTRAGEFKLSFDAEESTIYKANTSPAEDILRTIGTFTFNVTTGSTTVKSCNESCSSNAECPVNHRCYESRCRLVTNLSSTSCTNPPDQGLNRQCNEYCADTRECGTGFTCFFNRCRRPDNPDSEVCTPSTAAQQQAVAASCNQTCTNNAGCAANMRCFQGQCRLATNVSSTSCSPTSAKTVSPIYENKGRGGQATASPLPAATLRPAATATSGATASPSATASPTATGAGIIASPSPSPIAMPSPSPSAHSMIVEPEPSNPVLALFERFGITLPLAAMALGFILLLIVIVLTIMNQLRKRSGSGPITANKQTTQYETDLQARIEALKNQPPAPPAAMPSTPPPATPAPAGATPTMAPTAPVAPQVASQPEPQPPVTPPPSTLFGTTNPSPMATIPTTPMPSTPPAPQPTTASSSMLERLKQKGIAPPGAPNNGNTQG